MTGEAEAFEEASSAFGRVVRPKAVERTGIAEIGADRLVEFQRAFFENDPDRPAALGRQAANIPAEKDDGAAIGPVHADGQMDDGRHAGAGGADHGNEGSLIEPQVEGGESPQPTEGFVDAAKFQHSGRFDHGAISLHAILFIRCRGADTSGSIVARHALLCDIRRPERMQAIDERPYSVRNVNSVPNLTGDMQASLIAVQCGEPAGFAD